MNRTRLIRGLLVLLLVMAGGGSGGLAWFQHDAGQAWLKAFIEDRVNHMTVSVKPFGCMPSSGVSDGVQSLITAQWPEAIFLPIETTGDGKVNVYSRIQMMLFKARQRAREEFEAALAETGLDEETYRRRVLGSRRWRSPFIQPPHRAAGVATNLVYAVR